uniref:Uncharacterized protein n=1 Tax=Timema cristinae TaxID=61476 RepID=A0A7R9HBC3_TIMCR|nr:unnamed protein product [Timema cristinae]
MGMYQSAGPPRALVGNHCKHQPLWDGDSWGTTVLTFSMLSIVCTIGIAPDGFFFTAEALCRKFCIHGCIVTKERGEQLAIEYGIKFMETSAKASINVEDAFFTLARDIKTKMEKKLVVWARRILREEKQGVKVSKVSGSSEGRDQVNIEQ